MHSSRGWIFALDAQGEDLWGGRTMGDQGPERVLAEAGSAQGPPVWLGLPFAQTIDSRWG